MDLISARFSLVFTMSEVAKMVRRMDVCHWVSRLGLLVAVSAAACGGSGGKGVEDAKTDSSVPQDQLTGDQVPADSGSDVSEDLGPDPNDTQTDVWPMDQDQPDDHLVPPDVGEDTAEDVAVVPDPPAIDRCGAPESQWKPLTEVGKTTIWQEHLMSNLAAEDIEGILTDRSLDALVPVKYGVRNFRLRYVTQAKGELVQASALVGFPVGVPKVNKVPMILYYDVNRGMADACAGSLENSEAVVPLTVLASRGYLVVMPDGPGKLGVGNASPEGSFEPYLVGEAQALAGLDALRAARVSVSTMTGAPKVEPQQVIVMGTREGGQAALFSDLYSYWYTPEFSVVGVAVSGAAVDLTTIAADGCLGVGRTTSMTSAMLVAMQRWYGIPESMAAVLTNSEPASLATNLPVMMSTDCAVLDTMMVGVLSADEVFQPGFQGECSKDKWDMVEPFGCFLQQNSVVSVSLERKTNAPVLMLEADNDPLLDYEARKAGAQGMCGKGYAVEYRRCADEAGVALDPWRLLSVLSWVDSRVAGELVEQSVLCALDIEAAVCGN